MNICSLSKRLILFAPIVFCLPGCFHDKDDREIQAQIHHTAPVTDVAISADGRIMASASEDDTIRLFDISGFLLNFDEDTTSTVLTDELDTSPFMGGGGGVFAIDFSPQGDTLAAATTDEVLGPVVKIWDVETGERTGFIELDAGPAASLDYGLMGEILAAGTGWADGAGSALVWDTQSLEAMLTESYPVHHVHDVKFSPDGTLLAAARGDGVIAVWSTEDWSTVYELSEDDHRAHALAFSPAGDMLVSCGDDSGPGFHGEAGVVRFWDLSDGTLSVSYDLGTAPLHSIEFSPDGSIFVAAGESRQVIVSETWSGAIIDELKGHADTVRAMSFAPNGQVLVSGADDMFVRFWWVGDWVGQTCGDDIDNDGDGWTDDDDPDCADGNWESGFSGSSQCNDGDDNDNDGLFDSQDPGCEDALDDDEENDDVDGGPDGGGSTK